MNAHRRIRRLTGHDELLAEARAQRDALNVHAADCRASSLHHSQAWLKLRAQAPLDEMQQATALAHAEARYAALYGCSVETIQAAGIVCADGTLSETVDAPRAHHPRTMPLVGKADPGHALRSDWTDLLHAASRITRTAHHLNMELRGISRALFLVALWRGENPCQLRERWYSPGDLAPYWSVAWALCGDTPAAARGRANLLRYARAVLWCYQEVKADAELLKRQHRIADAESLGMVLCPKPMAPKNHAAAVYIAAAEWLWSDGATVSTLHTAPLQEAA